MSDFTFSGSTLTGYTGSGGAITLPSVDGATTITMISASAFTGNTSITAITIPSTYTTIEDGTGSNNIGNGAFSACTSLTSINASASNLTNIGNFACNNCSELTSFSFPNTLTSIGVAAFNACVKLNNVSFPSSLQTIGDFAFTSCYAFTSLTLNSGLLSIGVHAFEDCANLASITFNSDFQFMDYYAFINCPVLTSVTLPAQVNYYGGASGSFDAEVIVTGGNRIIPSPPVACFTAGTMILTPAGEVTVETLKPGDLVSSDSGRVIRLKAVLTTHLSATSEKTAPYLIPARTYGSSQPRDLILSPNHAFQMRRGVWMIPKVATSSVVRQVNVGEPITYYHLECPIYLRDNLVANGCIVESFGTLQTKKSPYTYSKRLKGFTRASVPSPFASITHIAH